MENNKRRTDDGTEVSVNKKPKIVDTKTEKEKIENRMEERAARVREIAANPRKFILESRKKVDPFSFKEMSKHVYCDGEVMFSVVLGRSDDKHAFYKMQILQSNNQSSDSYTFYSVSGCGGNMSGYQCSSECLDDKSAKDKFKAKYEELTGNVFDQKPFVQYPEKYYEMEID